MATGAKLAAASDTLIPVNEVTAAQSWENQILGLYSILYPLIAADFRLKMDCTNAHMELGITTPTDHTHLVRLPLVPDTSIQRIETAPSGMRYDRITKPRTTPIFEMKLRT